MHGSRMQLFIATALSQQTSVKKVTTSDPMLILAPLNTATAMLSMALTYYLPALALTCHMLDQCTQWHLTNATSLKRFDCCALLSSAAVTYHAYLLSHSMLVAWHCSQLFRKPIFLLLLVQSCCCASCCLSWAVGLPSMTSTPPFPLEQRQINMMHGRHRETSIDPCYTCHATNMQM